MKAVRFYGINDVRIEEIPRPVPKGGEVLIKVGGAGVCHSDLHIIKDGILGEIKEPFTLGHENAGWIEAVGEGVTEYKKGDAVLVYGPWAAATANRVKPPMKTTAITNQNCLWVEALD